MSLQNALPLDNARLAARLDELAGLLEAQGANAYRVRAYRRATQTVRSLSVPVHELLAARGAAALTELPGIGKALARTIDRLVHTDHLALLARLRDRTAPGGVFRTVYGIGPELARRIHDELGIESLAELEIAAHDGRLAALRGMGRGRVRGVRESLAGRLRPRPAMRGSRRSRPEPDGPALDVAAPDVAELLDIDREYRERAARGLLPLAAPRRFNPTHEAWLPVLRTERDGRRYRAHFSNTARAHEFGTTHDWVVIHREERGGGGPWTVVTAHLGELSGWRVVRGREKECERVYAGVRAALGPPSRG